MTVPAGAAFELPVSLEVGGVDSSVTVNGESTVIEAARQIAGTIAESEVRNLPLNGRNFLDAALLVPGVSSANVSATQMFPETSAVPGVGLSVSSQRNLSNNFVVDGLSANDDAAALSGITYGIDAVEQVQVVTSGGQAELGRALGGYVNVVTRSGTNALHGSLYDYQRDDRLNASNPLIGTALPLTQAQYGGSLGGPVSRDRHFFFANLERRQLDQSGLVTIRAATAATINARLSASGYQGPLVSRAADRRTEQRQRRLPLRRRRGSVDVEQSERPSLRGGCRQQRLPAEPRVRQQQPILRGGDVGVPRVARLGAASAGAMGPVPRLLHPVEVDDRPWRVLLQFTCRSPGSLHGLGPPDNDQRHRLVVNGSVQSSMDAPRNAWESLVNGFQLSGMLQAYSALPLNITCGVTTIQGTAGRPMVNGQFIPRNAGTGSDFFGVNLRLSRMVRLGSRLELEALAEVFNPTNRGNVVARNAKFWRRRLPHRSSGNIRTSDGARRAAIVAAWRAPAV